MAQSEKIFRDMLCERRSLPVETNDPSSAKTIDDLKRLVKELRNEVEAEKLKVRQTNRDHEREIKRIREEAQRKLEVTVESTCVHKDLERLAEIKKLEEKLEKQRIQEVQALDKERAEELIKHQRKWQREKDEAVRAALEAEKRKFGEEAQHMYQQEEVHARESKLAREVFILEEQTEKLEEQVQNLRSENKTKIELLRRMRHQYDNELEGVIKQHQSEAARDMAQLRLAEQLISEREHVLHSVEYKADMAMLEKEALEEELVAMKSEKNMSMVSNTSMGATSPSSGRKSVGTFSGLLQKRVDDLERNVKRLEEEKSSLKQENASLRKKLIQETGGAVGSGGEGAGGRVSEEKAKTLRKRNAELVALAKQLDERCKALKMENEQLQKQSTTPGDTEQQIRKSLARHHTKDIMEYTRQITSKDREISELKRKLAKFEVITPTRPEPCPELERKLKAHCMEKLRMEKLVAKLYSKLPDMVEVGVSRRELEAESTHSDHLEVENRSLKKELEQLHQAISKGDEVDYQQEKDTQERQVQQLGDENTRLRDQLSSVEKDYTRLKESSEQSVSELEQRCHELSKQLEVSQLAVKELQSNVEQCSLLERQVELLNTQLAARDSRVEQLETECEGQRSLVESREQDIDGLKVQLGGMENLLSERESDYNKLQASIADLRPPPKPTMVEVYQQTEPVQTSRLASHEHTEQEATSLTGSKVNTGSSDHEVGSVKSPRISAMSAVSHRLEGNTSLETEMKALGLEVTDSFDSSEGVGFSEVNLDDSAQSVDEEKLPPQLPISNEQGVGHDTPQQSAHESKPLQSLDETDRTDETHQDISIPPAVNSADSTVPIATLVDPQLSTMVVDTPTDQLAPPTHIDDEMEDDLSTSSSRVSVEESSPVTVQAGSIGEDPNVAIFIARFTYKPSEMSPNPNFDLELPLTAGDYLYVYGSMDDDGFFHGQLMNGENGLVPSNFIERVMDDDENSPQPPRKSMRRRLSNLQDITEEDEEVSSGDSHPPPSGLEMDQQLVDEQGYSIAMHWNRPHPLPAHITGYNVYINGSLSESVSGADQTSLLLKGVPRKQLVKISVRTVTEEGESPDPKRLIILNPQYPQPPTELELSQKDEPVSLLVTWCPSEVLEGGNAITGYAVYINDQCCVKLASHPGPVERVCTQLLPGDVEHLRPKLATDSKPSLTVRSVSHDYESIDSSALLVSKEQLSHLLRGGEFTGGDPESSTSSQTSITSSEEEREVYSPAKMINELQQSSEHVIQSESRVTSNEGHVTNGNPDSFTEDIDSEGSVPVHYYRAMYSYNPAYQSPNEAEEVDDELTFQEGDVIVVSGGVDEDGYLRGELKGQIGFVPSNMVEEITDPDELAQVKVTLAVHSRRRGQQALNGVGKESSSSKKMRAMFDYDPEQDSPNENSEVELTITEGDVVTVFGSPDEEGFYKAELSGKQGLVPHNFLEEVSPDDDHHDNEGVEVFAADEESMQRAQQILNKADPSRKKRKGILSQGKSLITKSLGKKTN